VLRQVEINTPFLVLVIPKCGAVSLGVSNHLNPEGEWIEAVR
jgi:hypothetical protein